MMNPVINNNGATRESHVEARRDILTHLHASMKALQEIAPHGRDYQTLAADEAAKRYGEDLDIYRDRFNKLDALYNEIMEEAVSILNGGN